MRKPFRPTSEDLWAAVVMAAGILLRLAFLGSRTAGGDESKTIILCQAAWNRVFDLVRALETSPPLYFYLAKLWSCAFSDVLLSVRLFSVAAGTAALFFFWRLCRRALPTGRLFALLLGSLSSCWIHASQEGRPYALFLLLALLHMELALDLRDAWSVRRLCAYWLVGLAGMWTHYCFNFLLLADFIYVIRGNRSGGHRPAFVLAHALLAAAYAPWLYSALGRQVAFAKGFFPHSPGFARSLQLPGGLLLDISFVEFYYPNVVRAAGAVVAASTIGAFLHFIRLEAGPEQRWLRWGFHTLLLSICAAEIAGHLFHMPFEQTRYFIFLSPIVYIAMTQSVRLFRRPAQLPLQGALGLFLISGTVVYFVSNTVLDPHYARLAESIRRRADRRDVMIHLAPYYYHSMRYYYLPERPHYFWADRPVDAAWARLPGYPALVDSNRLARVNGCIVIDPSRRLAGNAVWRTTGPALRALVAETASDHSEKTGNSGIMVPNR